MPSGSRDTAVFQPLSLFGRGAELLLAGTSLHIPYLIPTGFGCCLCSSNPFSMEKKKKILFFSGANHFEEILHQVILQIFLGMLFWPCSLCSYPKISHPGSSQTDPFQLNPSHDSMDFCWCEKPMECTVLASLCGKTLHPQKAKSLEHPQVFQHKKSTGIWFWKVGDPGLLGWAVKEHLEQLFSNISLFFFFF